MTKRVWLMVAAAAALLTACGGAASTASSGSAVVDGRVGEISAQPAPARIGAPGPAAVPGGSGSVSAVPPTASLPAPPPFTGEGPKVIRSAQLTIGVESGTFDSGLTNIESVIRSQGGYISGSTAQASGNEALRTGTFSFQIPAIRFDEALDQLRKLGRVEAFSVSGNDVSLQYVDLQARLRNAEAQAAAIQALLGKATTVQEIIAVQNQLGQITAQVEQLKGQINYFDHATGYSTISVTIREAGAVAKPANDAYGTRTALAAAAHNFLATVNVVIVALGSVGPFLILALLGLLGFWWASRRRHQRQAA